MTHGGIAKASLELINPFDREGLDAGRARDERPGAVSEMSSNFVVCGLDHRA